jgi:hypothetical protein
VTSRKRFLIILLRKGINDNSDTLKKAITRNGIIVITAKIVAIVLSHHVLATQFQTAIPIHNQLAKMTSWISETFINQI